MKEKENLPLKLAKAQKRVLIVTAVKAEQQAVLRGLDDHPGFTVAVVGVGPVAAAVNTLKLLLETNYSLVVCAGIAGGFPGMAGLGSLVVASEIIAADLGVESPDGFSTLEELGFGVSRITVPEPWSECLTEALRNAQLPVTAGPVLTVSTVTGTAGSADRLTERFPGAAAEAMEGFGAALAAQTAGIPVVELRSVSNLVGPRDREAWQIKEALALLEKASSVLATVILEGQA